MDSDGSQWYIRRPVEESATLFLDMSSAVLDLNALVDDLPDLRYAPVQTKDGEEVIGSNAGVLLEAMWPLKSQIHSDYSKDTRDTISKFKHLMKRIPDPSAEGVTEITMAMIAANIEKKPNWMDRVTDMIINTTDTYKDMKELVQKNMPKEPKNASAVKNVFDVLLDTLQADEGNILDDAVGYYKRLLLDFSITDDLLEQDLAQDFEEPNQIHKTVTKLIKQYVGNLWTERFIGAKGEIQQDRMTRLALHFRDFSEDEMRAAEELGRDTVQTFVMHEFVQGRRSRAQRQLDKLSEDIGLPTGTFEDDPISWIPLGEYAPTAKAWKSAVNQLLSGERSSMLDILRGWGPEAAAYAASKGGTGSKRKKKKRTKKHKMGSQYGTQTCTQDSDSDVWEDALEIQPSEADVSQESSADFDVTTVPAKASASTPTVSSRQIDRRRKSRRGRRVVQTEGEHTPTSMVRERATPPNFVVSEDWATIRRNAQADLRRLKSHLASEAKKDQKRLESLIADRESTAALKSLVTDATKIRGRRAGRRAPYAVTRADTFSRRAPRVVPSTRMRPSRSSEVFDGSSLTWPALDGSQNAASLADTEAMSVISDDVAPEETEQDPLTKALSSLNLEDFSTVGVDPWHVELVSQFVPEVEASYGRSLSLAEVVGLLGGWRGIEAAMNE